MKNSLHILSALLLMGMVMPQGAFGDSINSTGYSAPESKSIQYIKPPKKAERKGAVTPYGDFCTRCSNYGSGSTTININDAIAAMEHYFKSKGFEVREVNGRGRFLKAEIYSKDLLVDKVLFDRRTGRIRSIY